MPDGSSPTTAIPVGSIHEEYAWLASHLPGVRLVSQALVFFEERPFDLLIVADDLGDERRVYFDISRFYGR